MSSPNHFTGGLKSSETRKSLYAAHGGAGKQTFEFCNPLLSIPGMAAKVAASGGFGSTSSSSSAIAVSGDKSVIEDVTSGGKGHSSVKEFLASISSFADFSDQQLLKLERNAFVRRIPADNVIFFQGDEGEEFFVIHQGTVEIFVQDDPQKVLDIRTTKELGRVVNRLNEGSYFGERALMTSEPRAATVKSSCDVTLYVFTRKIYEEVINGVVQSSAQEIDLSKDHETRSLFKHITQVLDIQRNTKKLEPEVCKTMYNLTTAFTPELSADQIISRMVLMVRTAVKADRVGLFLLAEDKNFMVLKVSEISKGIRLPVKGLAGVVLRDNAVLNIQDAYSDERFDQTMDKRTGYRTHQVLGVPVRNPVTGEAVGLLQVNNRVDEVTEAFTENNVATLEMAAELLSEMLQGRVDVFLNSDWWNGVSVSHSSEIPRPFKIGLHSLLLGAEELSLVKREHLSIFHVDMYLHLAVHEMCDPIRFEFKPATVLAAAAAATASKSGKSTSSTTSSDSGSSSPQRSRTSSIDPVLVRIDQQDDFDINVSNLPKSARIFFKVSGKKRKGVKSVPLGWAAAAIFDFKGCMNYNVELCLFKGDMDSFLTTSDSNIHDPLCSKVSVVLGADLSVLDKSTGLPRVRIVHEAPDMEEPIRLDETPLTPEENTKLDELRKLSFNPCGMKEITDADRAFLWNVRLQIAQRSELLPAFVMSIRWQNSEQVRELYDLLELWKTPTADIALQLLDRKFMDPVVRAYAVNCLEMLGNKDLSLYMLQLCQQLKYEMFVDSALSRFLLRRALLNPRVIGHIFYWQLQSEVHNIDVKHRFERLLQLYIQNCGSHRTALGHQIFVMRKLEAIAHRVCLGDSREERLRILREQLTIIQETLPAEFQLPLNPELTVTGIVVDKCRVMESKKKPLWLTFLDSKGAHFVVMLKVGDDLRQDALIMQLLRVMNDLWRKEHLDMKMNLYDCISTGDERGLLQVVLNSTTVGSILLQMTDEEINHKRSSDKPVKRGSWQRKFKSAMKALGDYDVIRNWMEETIEQAAPADASDEWLQAEMGVRTRNFLVSLAAYCVASYVLGLGDRHNDNLMITNTAHFFHIDFGHILGNFKSKYGVKRERAPFVFTHSMKSVMWMEGEFETFTHLCCEIYNILRANASMLVSLCSLAIPCNLPELQCEEDVSWIYEKLLVHSTDEEAAEHFIKMLDESLACTATRLNDAAHMLAHA